MRSLDAFRKRFPSWHAYYMRGLKNVIMAEIRQTVYVQDGAPCIIDRGRRPTTRQLARLERIGITLDDRVLVDDVYVQFFHVDDARYRVLHKTFERAEVIPLWLRVQILKALPGLIIASHHPDREAERRLLLALDSETVQDTARTGLARLGIRMPERPWNDVNGRWYYDCSLDLGRAARATGRAARGEAAPICTIPSARARQGDGPGGRT